MRFFTVFNLTLSLLLGAVVTLISPGNLFALINLPGLLDVKQAAADGAAVID